MVKSSVDYATDNITVYRYCVYECAYCWAWRVPLFSYRISRGKYDPIVEARKYLRIKGRRVIVVSFTSDPYPEIEIYSRLTGRVLKILAETNHRVLVLTKAPNLAVDLDLYTFMKAPDMWLGTTIITLKPTKLEPKAPEPSRRLEALKYAKQFGVKTWLSVEPIIPYVTYPVEIIEKTIGYVDFYVLGAYNYYRLISLPRINRYIPENGKFTKRELTVWYKIHVPKAIKFIEKHGKQYFIKKELKKYLGN